MYEHMQMGLPWSENRPRSIGTVCVDNEIRIRIVLETFAHLLPVSGRYSFNCGP
jgi:hypothetical protein